MSQQLQKVELAIAGREPHLQKPVTRHALGRQICECTMAAPNDDRVSDRKNTVARRLTVAGVAVVEAQEVSLGNLEIQLPGVPQHAYWRHTPGA
jgi:hypothetical protein